MNDNLAMDFDSKSITCPTCKTSIPIGEAVTLQIKEQIRLELSDEYNAKWKLEKGKLEKKIREQALDDVSMKMQDIQSELDEKKRKLQEAGEKEMEWLKEKRALEEQKQNLNLEMERRLSAERARLTQEVADRTAEEYRLKLSEREQKVAELARQIDELKRRAEQGSQQAQGEALEVEIENLLRETFRTDRIQPVPKGIRGADVIQEVVTAQGHSCGWILWESKRTKAWSDSWIAKLNSDKLETKADLAVLVSTTLPKDMNRIGQIEGVWVVDFSTAMELATVLRASLSELAVLRAAMVGKQEKAERVYSYITGHEFRQRVEALLTTFVELKNSLQQEKRAMERLWGQREKQIESVLYSTSGLYGQLQGMIGAALPTLPELELPLKEDSLL